MGQHAADDQRWMRAALWWARYGLGRTAPNPSVGCVIVKNDILIGHGRTADGGRPHAETQALTMAGAAAKDATVYVTLEPCAHHGQTPPCADALINSGVARVVVGMRDPDTQVAGAGVAMLKDAGIDVVTGLDFPDITAFYRPYSKHRSTHSPFVTVKVASTLDGKIALADGQSKWITGARTRHYVHVLRAQHDAVLTSGETMRADDPALTCRLAGYDGPQPTRVVVSRHMILPATSQLAQTSDQARVILMGVENGDTHQLPTGIETVTVAADDEGFPALDEIMRQLGARGVMSVLVEAGGQFLAALMRAGLIDQLIWTRSSGVIGGDGRPSISMLGLDSVDSGNMFRHIASRRVENDVIEIYDRAPYLT